MSYRDYFLTASVEPGAGFAEHFMHGLLGFDHLLASFAIALMSVMRYRHEFWLPSASFLVAMSLGFMLGALGVDLPSDFLWAGAITAALFGLLPFWLPCPFCGAWALVSLVGVMLGLAHAPAGTSPEPEQVVAGMALTFGNAFTMAPMLLVFMWFTRADKPYNYRREIKKVSHMPSVVDEELRKEREGRRQKAG